MKIKEITQKIEGFTNRNKPALLTGLAVAGTVASIIQAYRSAPVAHDILTQHRNKMKNLPSSEEGNPEIRKELICHAIKEIVPVVLPSVIITGATIACIVGSNRASSKKIAVLSAAYSMSESAVKELNGKMQEMLDKSKIQEIKESITKDKLEKDPAPKSESEIILTGDGDVLCKDLYSGRFFRSNAQKIGRVINELSSRVQSEMYISLNEFYDELGLPRIKMGDEFGWNVDDLEVGILPITTCAQLTENQTPCLCIDYDARLRTDYRRMY